MLLDVCITLIEVKKLSCFLTTISYSLFEYFIINNPNICSFTSLPTSHLTSFSGPVQLHFCLQFETGIIICCYDSVDFINEDEK